MKAYKGFNKDMTCRDFQYEEGKEYTHDGKVKVCESGFHACELPLDVLRYYNLGESEFHEVELDGEISKSNEDTKVAAEKIKIGARINILGMIKAQIEVVKEKAFKGNANTSGYKSTSATSGYKSTSATSGDYSTSATSGYKSTSATSGEYSTSATSGISSTSATSGEYSTSATSGDYGTSATSGDSSTSATSGEYSTSATSGISSTSATSGDYSTSATSGYKSTSATSGYKSTSATSGDYSTSATSGISSTSATSGYSTRAIANGPESIAVAWGYESIAKGCLGAHIVISEWEYDGDRDSRYEDYDYRNDKDHWHLKCAKCFQIDGERLKPDTYYKLENGEPVEVESEE